MFAGPAFTFRDPSFIGRAIPVKAGSSGPASILRWEFNEGGGSTANDSSGNGWTGTCSGLTWITGPNSDGAISCEFGGTPSVVTAGNFTPLAASQHASLSGWFYSSGFGDSWVFGCTTTANYRFEAVLASGAVYITIENGGANYPYFSWSLTGWHFLVVAFDGTQSTAANRVLVYVDGGTSVSLTAGGAGNPSALGTAAQLGPVYVNYDVANLDYRAGEYDDCQVWNITLTQAQSAALYTAGAQ